MPKGQSPRSNLLARFEMLQGRLEGMRKDIPDTATGAVTNVDRALQAYTNTMSSIGQQLVTSNPNYRALRRRLSSIENGLDTNAERLLRQRNR